MDSAEDEGRRSVAGADLRDRFEQLYTPLKQAARRELARAGNGTLNATALVHDLYLRLAESGSVDCSHRASFLALAAKAMRCALVDHARARAATKRGGGLQRVTLMTDVPLIENTDCVDLIAIEQGLESLEAVDPRLVTVVECRFFAGMEFEEIAEHLGVSERTARRDWRRARAFLVTRMGAVA